MVDEISIIIQILTYFKKVDYECKRKDIISSVAFRGY